MVGWQSGRMRFFAKEVNSKGFRGFESHPDRHFLCLVINWLQQ